MSRMRDVCARQGTGAATHSPEQVMRACARTHVTRVPALPLNPAGHMARPVNIAAVRLDVLRLIPVVSTDER